MKLYNLLKNITNRLGHFDKKALILGVMGVICGGLWGATYKWTGGASGDWATTTNWTPNGTPGTGDTVIINTSTSTVNISFSSDITIHGLLAYGTNPCTITATSGSTRAFNVSTVFVGTSSDGFRTANGLPAGLSVPSDHSGNLGFDGSINVTIATLDTSSWTQNTSEKNKITLGASTTFNVTTKWDTGINEQTGNRDRTVIQSETGTNITFSGIAVGSQNSIQTLFNDLSNAEADISNAKAEPAAGQPALYIWKGTDTVWTNTANWSTGAVPVSNASVIIPKTANQPSASAADISSTNVKSISLSADSELTITTDYTLSDANLFIQPENGTASLVFNDNLTILAGTQIPNIKVKTKTFTTDNSFKYHSLEVTSTSTLKSGTKFLVSASATGSKFGDDVTITGTPAQSGIAIAGNVIADTPINFIVENGVLNHSIEQNIYYSWSDNATVVLKDGTTLSMSGNKNSEYKIETYSAATKVYIAGTGTVSSITEGNTTCEIHFGTDSTSYEETIYFAQDTSITTTGKVVVDKSCKNLTGNIDLTLHGDLQIDSEQLDQLGVNLIFDAATTISSAQNVTLQNVTLKNSTTFQGNFTVTDFTANTNMAGKSITLTSSKITVSRTLALSGSSGTGNELSLSGSAGDGFVLPADKTGGDYLKIDSNIAIYSASGTPVTYTEAGHSYTATNSVPAAGITDAQYAAVINKGWAIKDKNLFTYKWKVDAGSSDWTDPDNWDIGLVPVTDATIEIQAVTTGTAPSISTDAAGGNLTIDTDATLTFSSTGNLALSGKAGAAAATSTLTNKGTIVYQNSGRITDGTNVINDVTTSNNGTVEYNTGSGSITEIDSTLDYYNLKISGGSWSCTNTVTATNLTVTGGSVSGTFTADSLTVSGDCTVSTNSVFITDSINLSANIDGGTTAELQLYPKTAGKTIYLGTDVASEFSLTDTEIGKLKGKKITLGENTTNTYAIEINETFSSSYPTELLTKSSITASGDYSISAGTNALTLTAEAGIGSSTSPIKIDNTTTTIGGDSGNLFATNTTGDIYLKTTGSIVLGANLATPGTLSLDATGSITNTAGTLSASTVTLASTTGIGASDSAVSTSASTIDLAASTSGNIYVSNGTAASYNASTTAGSIEITNTGALTVETGKSISTTDKDITLKASSFVFTASTSVSAGSGTLTLTSNTAAGTINLKDSDIGKLSVTGGLVIGDDNHTGTIALTNNSSPITLSAPFTVRGKSNVIFTNSATINTNDKTVAVKTHLTNNGTINGSSANITISRDYTGTGTLVTSSDKTQFNRNVDLSTGTFTVTTGTVIFNRTSDTNHTLKVKADGSTVFNNITINANSYLTCAGEFNVTGDWTNNGTFTGTGSTIHFAGTSEVKGSAITTFNNLTIDSGKKLKSNVTATEGNIIKLSGNWTNNSGNTAFDANSGTVQFTGSSEITGETTFNNFTTSNLGGKTITLKTDVTVNGSLALNGTAPVAGSPAVAASYLTITDDGNGYGFILPAGSKPAATTGSYLKIGSNVKIKAPAVVPATPTSDGIEGNFYKADNSLPLASETNAAYATVINNGWRIKDLSALTYTWLGGAAATDTDWATRAHWDIGIVPGITTEGATQSSGATVIIPDGKTSYPVLGATAYTLRVLTIGTSVAATHDASLTLGGTADVTVSTKNGAGTTVDGTLTNHSQIIYSSSGRIIGASGPINDSAKGSVEYKTATGTIADVDYYDLKITSGTWSNTTDKSITINNTLSVTGSPTLNFAKGLTCKGGSISIPSTATLKLGGTIKSISDGATPTKYTQEYNCPVTLSANADFQGSTITFENTINATTAGTETLKISGNGVFKGIIGGTKSPKTIEVTGTSNINTTAITSTGDQAYIGAVTIGEQDTVFTSSSGLVKFSSTLTGTPTVSGTPATTTYHNLTVTGNGQFDGAVSKFEALSISGAVTVNSDITTNNSTQFGTTTTLAANKKISSITNTFTGEVTMGTESTITATSSNTFSAKVNMGDKTTITATTMSNFAANITATATNNTITLDTPVTITNSITLAAANVTFKNNISGAGKQLTLEATASFSGASEITTNILNKGTINVPSVADAGTPPVPQTAITFKGTYTANDATQPGSLTGSSTTNPYIDFYKAATFGTFTANGDTVRFMDTSSKNFNPNSQIFTDIIFENGTTTISESFTADNLTINSSAKVTATDNKTISINKNWTNNATVNDFTSNKSTVIFQSANNSAISGDNKFYNLTCTTSDKILVFDAGKTQEISNSLTLTGTPDHQIILKSSAVRTPTPTQWNIKCTGNNANNSISFVDVQDSNNISSYRLNATDSKDSANNDRWNFAGNTYIWTGTADTNWFNKENWDKLSVPGIGAVVTIANTTNKPVLEHKLEDQNSDTEYASIGSEGTLTVEAGAQLDLATFELTAKSITNNGHIRLSGAQTITGETAGSRPTFTNNTDSKVEYYGTLQSNGNAAMGTRYAKLEFTDGANGSIAEDITVEQTTLINNGTGNSLTLSGNNTFNGDVTISSGTINITSAENIKLKDPVNCDKLTLIATGKTVTIKGSLISSDNVDITASIVNTTGGTESTPIEINVSGSNGLKITGDFENSGHITNNSTISITGNLTDTNAKWTEGAGKIIFNGTENQIFNTNPETKYFDVAVNKPAGNFNFTPDFKANTVTITKIADCFFDSTTQIDTFNMDQAANTQFKGISTIGSLTDTAKSGNITFFANTTISSDTNFLTTGTLTFGSGTEEDLESQITTTFGTPPAYKSLTHTTGETILYGTLNSSDASFGSTDCKTNIIINCNNLKLSGNVTSKAAYLKINGNITTSNAILISPNLLLNGSFSGDGLATLENNFYLFAEPEATQIEAGTITVTKDIIIDAPRNILTSGTISATNIVIYRGNITAKADSILSASKDFIILGAEYDIENKESGNKTEFVYQQDRLSNWNFNRKDFTSTSTPEDMMPDKSPLSTVESKFSASYTSEGNSVIKAVKNFYANGTALTGTDKWFIDIPDITNAKNGFAETINSTISYSTIRCIEDNSADGSKAKMPAFHCEDKGNNINWIFDNFQIVEAQTERDNVIKITFNRPIRNANSELINSISRFSNNTEIFEGFYTDPDCQNPLKVENISSGVIYIKAKSTWNTDATGKSAGTDYSTDRNGIHKQIIPYIQIKTLNTNSSVHISDIWGKRIVNYDDANRFTDVTDHTGPVLYSVRTGQELHTPYDSAKGAESQPSYDSHNFIEFRYSEKVNFGDTSLPEDASKDKANFNNNDISKSIWLPSSDSTMNKQYPSIENVRVRDYFGTLENDITQPGNLIINGLGTIESGLLHTGSNGKTDKYVNALYRIDQYSIRLSIAGYTENTVQDRNGAQYKNWIGYIESSIQPWGTVTMPGTINNKVTDCALNLDGKTPLYNPQELYKNNQIVPVVNQCYADGSNYINSGVYGDWDLSAPTFAPLRLNTATLWGNKDYYEAVGNTSGAGSTLDKIEFHLFDNTPLFTEADAAAWLTEKGWCFNNVDNATTLYDSLYTYCADIIGGARQFDTNAAQRTSGGIRYSSIDNCAPAFKYIDMQTSTAVPNKPFDNSENGIYPGAKASLFIGSSPLRRAAADPDGLYFGIGLSEMDLPTSKSFTISYDDSIGYITDLAGNRLRSATIRTIDRTPPSFDIILSPISQKEVYAVFVKKLISDSSLLKFRNNEGDETIISEQFETLIPRCFELISIDANGNPIINQDIQIDYSVPARIENVISDVNSQEFTILRLTLTAPVTLPAVEKLYIRTRHPEGYEELTQDPITGIKNSRVSFVQDSIGNYMQMYTAHVLSDIAINAITTLYAYDTDMTYNSDKIMDGLYDQGSWAVHDWNEEQQNYGTLPANHPYGIVSDIITETESSDDLPAGVRIFLSASPDKDSIASQYNSDLNRNIRVWLPEVTNGLLPAFSLKNNPSGNYFQTDSFVLNEAEALNRIEFNIPKEISEGWGPGQQVSFVYGILGADGNPYRIYPSPYFDVSTGKYNLLKSDTVPLYSIRLKDSSDITSLDLWSFKTKATTEQRGGVTILNNVINATNGEKTVVKVNMPVAGNLNVMVMTVDGSIVTYLNHGQTDAGEHYYSWNGQNNKKTPVARGIYFIRVIGNGLDETRKVMVVK